MLAFHSLTLENCIPTSLPFRCSHTFRHSEFYHLQRASSCTRTFYPTLAPDATLIQSQGPSTTMTVTASASSVTAVRLTSTTFLTTEPASSMATMNLPAFLYSPLRSMLFLRQEFPTLRTSSNTMSSSDSSTQTQTPAQTTGASSTSDLCLTNPLNPLCPLIPATVTQSPTPQEVDPDLCGVAGGAPRTCPTTSTTSLPQPTPGTTGDIIVSDGHVTSLTHSSTISTTSFTCQGNSDSCYCLSGTCHTQTTFATQTLSQESGASGATTTSSGPAQLNTSAPSNGSITASHGGVNALPIAIGVAIPIALIFLLLGSLYLWRRTHRKSYEVYSSYCPFHNSYRGVSAILARWKLTRQRNRIARARGYSAGPDSVGPTSEKYSTDTFRSVGDGMATVNTLGVAREGDAAANPLARWRRAQQDRLAALENRREAEMSAEAAETLRRYEIERAKRLKDFGVRAMSPEVREAVFSEKTSKQGTGREVNKQSDGPAGRERRENAITRATAASPSVGTLGGSTQRGSGHSDDNWL